MSEALDWPWPEPTAICSCGEIGCMETSWEHEWDPVFLGDSCVLLCGTGISMGDEYERFGSGYAHVECIEAGA